MIMQRSDRSLNKGKVEALPESAAILVSLRKKRFEPLQSQICPLIFSHVGDFLIWQTVTDVEQFHAIVVALFRCCHPEIRSEMLLLPARTASTRILFLTEFLRRIHITRPMPEHVNTASSRVDSFPAQIRLPSARRGQRSAHGAGGWQRSSLRIQTPTGLVRCGCRISRMAVLLLLVRVASWRESTD